jgi:hypothetical protein
MKWWVKSLVQASIAQLPYGEAMNHRLQIWNGFYRRFRWAVENNVRHLCNLVETTRKFGLQIDGSVAVEVGTGWAPTLPVGMYLVGAEVHTYDHMRHLRATSLNKVLDFYPEFFPRISERLGIAPAVLHERLAQLRQGEKQPVCDWLNRVNIHYHAPGDAGVTALAPNSVDLHFSIAVLEHISEANVKRILLEAQRILKPGGLSYHHIGLHDHLTETDMAATKINFLKFNDLTWRFLGQNRIQFHNRMRQSEFVNIFQERDLDILQCESDVDEASVRALSSMRLNKKYRSFNPADLATYVMTICVRKPPRMRTVPRGCGQFIKVADNLE